MCGKFHSARTRGFSSSPRNHIDMDSWTQCEGALLDGQYRLGACLDSGGSRARFRVQHGDPKRPAMIATLVEPDSGGSAGQLARWRLAQDLDHPNLEHIYAAGLSDVDGTEVIYALADQTDDNLASVLAERPLDTAEARQLLDSLVNVVQYLHGLGISHREIRPANVLAAGNTILLSAGTLAKADAGDLPVDIRSLGATLMEALTQRVPDSVSAKEISSLPAPFASMIRHSLTEDPGKRWTIAQIAASLEAPSRAATSERVREFSLAPAQKRPLAWVYMLAALAVLLCIFVVARISANSAKQAALVITPVAKNTTPVQPASPPLAATLRKSPAPLPPPAVVRNPEPAEAHHGNRTLWRVVTYTYSRAKDAEHKAEHINAEWPDLRAEVFSPNGEEAPPYLVVLGGRMQREEAMQLRDEARAKGLPRDTYAQNFSR